MPASARITSRRPPLSGGLITAVTWGMMVLGTAALASVIYLLWPRWPDAPPGADAPTLPVVVGEVSFNVPPGAIRQKVQRHPGTQERVDLAYAWPTLAPAATVPKAEIGEPPPAMDRIFVTIAAAPTALAPEERFKTVYPRYTENVGASAPAGLSLLPFRSGTPYQGEDLLFVPEAPERFILRCTRNQGMIAGSCIHERMFAGASVTMRFPRTLLDDWRNVLTGIDRLIEELQPTRR